MSEIDDILGQIPLGEIAGRLGVDESQAESASRAALPALLGGLHANAQDPAGAASLEGALQQHDGGLLGSGLDAVDANDGQKIVGNIFGDQTDQVVSRLGGVGGTGGSGIVQQLLPLLAPYVLAYLGKRLQGSGGLGACSAGCSVVAQTPVARQAPRCPRPRAAGDSETSWAASSAAVPEAPARSRAAGWETSSAACWAAARRPEPAHRHTDSSFRTRDPRDSSPCGAPG